MNTKEIFWEGERECVNRKEKTGYSFEYMLKFMYLHEMSTGKRDRRQKSYSTALVS